MTPLWFTVERDGHFSTVRAQSPVSAATRLYPDLRPPAWREEPDAVYGEITVVNGVAKVYPLRGIIPNALLS